MAAYDTKIKGRAFVEVHTHEEADTLIPNQVLASTTEHPCCEICDSSPVTDVFILLINIVSCGLLAHQAHPLFNRQRRKYREKRHNLESTSDWKLEMPRVHWTT